MKKLMIAAAIVCAAAFAQAATVNWSSASAVKGPSTAAFVAGLVNGESYSASATDSKNVTTSSYQAYGSGTLAYTLALTYDLGSGEVTENLSGTLAKNAGISTQSKIQSTVKADLFDAANKGVDYSYKLILTDTGKDGKDQKFTITATIEGNGTVQPNGDIFFSSGVPTTWVASVESVPEPTSGLLLLLGVAGLALRRRRA